VHVWQTRHVAERPGQRGPKSPHASFDIFTKNLLLCVACCFCLSRPSGLMAGSKHQGCSASQSTLIGKTDAGSHIESDEYSSSLHTWLRPEPGPGCFGGSLGSSSSSVANRTTVSELVLALSCSITSYTHFTSYCYPWVRLIGCYENDPTSPAPPHSKFTPNSLDNRTDSTIRRLHIICPEMHALTDITGSYLLLESSHLFRGYFRIAESATGGQTPPETATCSVQPAPRHRRPISIKMG